MNNSKLSSMVKIGLILNYISAAFLMFFWIMELILFPDLAIIWILFLLYDVIVVILSIYLHLGILKSRVAVGILSIFLNIISGVLILINSGEQNDEVDIEKSLENNQKLLDKGTISQEEYEIRRRKIIEK